MTDYIYALRCPLSGEIRYIGKTNNPRQRRDLHVWWARQGTHTYVARWIAGLLKDKLRPTLEVIFRVPEGDAWQDHEKRLIKEYRDAGHLLMNLTAGGDGVVFLSEERSAAAKLARRPGWTDESSMRRSESLKMFWADPENKSRVVASRNAALYANPEWLNRLKKGIKRSPEGEARRVAVVRLGKRRTIKDRRQLTIF